MDGGSPAAIIVTGAGYDPANGLYIATGKSAHNAPVFENDQRCLLSREPHKSQKTGQTCFGWILGQELKPLYIIKSESLTPPTDGWRKYSGAAPAPVAQSLDSLEQAAQAAGRIWKEQGNKLFTARRYDEAVAKWTRALCFVADLEGDMLHVALYSNRAEGRLRLEHWADALSDAQAALQLRPTYDKALLRAAIAARELKRLDLAHEFVRMCLEAHPEHLEGEHLLQQLEQLMGEEHERKLPRLAQCARRKLQDSWRKEAAAEDSSKLLKAFAAKDTNSRKGFKAFEGYSDKRAKPEERPPLHELPYHKMDLPKEQVDLMDSVFGDMRQRADEKRRSMAEERESYEKLKREYKRQAEMNSDPEPPLKPPHEEAPPTPEKLPQVKPQVRRQQPLVRAVLAEEDKRRIDALFEELAAKALTEQAEMLPKASERRERLDRSKALVTSRDAGGVDRRTVRERQLDEEEANERRQRDLTVRAELQRVRVARRGEPTKFGQASGEVYCWWCLPSEIGGREVSVKASHGGTWLAVTVRGVAIFDRALFGQVRADDVVWSVDEGELHVTLTKVERNKLWEQLGVEPTPERNERGEVLEESLPEPLSATDRLEKFQQMVTGDDGVEFNYDDLDADAQRLVDTIRRYRKAQAAGDNEALSLAECDLQEFGKMVI